MQYFVEGQSLFSRPAGCLRKFAEEHKMHSTLPTLRHGCWRWAVKLLSQFLNFKNIFSSLTDSNQNEQRRKWESWSSSTEQKWGAHHMSTLVLCVHIDTLTHTHTNTHPDEVLQSLAWSLSDGPWQIIVRVGSKPRGHRRHPSARLLSGYCSQTYALIEPSSSPHTLTHLHAMYMSRLPPTLLHTHQQTRSRGGMGLPLWWMKYANDGWLLSRRLAALVH